MSSDSLQSLSNANGRAKIAKYEKCLCLCQETGFLSERLIRNINTYKHEFLSLCQETKVFAHTLQDYFENVITNLKANKELSSELIAKGTELCDISSNLSGKLHDAQNLVKYEDLKAKLEKQVAHKKEEYKNAESNLRWYQEQANKKFESAVKWSIAAMIPVVNFVALPIAIHRQSQATSAMNEEVSAIDEAIYFENRYEKAKEECENANVS